MKGRTNFLFNVLPKFFFVVSLTIGLSAAFSVMACQEESCCEVPMCPFEEQEGRTIVSFDGPKLYGSHLETGSMSTNIPAGVYKVTLSSYDGYVGRDSVEQANESWYSVLKNGSNIVATTSVSEDLEAYVTSATETYVVDENLVVSEDVDSVTAVHAPVFLGSGSVYAICVAFDKVENIEEPEPEPEEPIYDPPTDEAGVGSITGYKYRDLDGATTTEDWNGLENWGINLFASSTELLATTTTNSLGYFEFIDLIPDDYTLTEDLLEDWIQFSAPGTITVSANATSTVVFVNYYSTTTPEEPEPEPTPMPTPTPTPSPGGGGGGGGGGKKIYLEIKNEKIKYIATSTVLITWETNLQSTSWVRYDTASNTSAHLPFEEYLFVTPVREFYETEHSIQVTGLKHDGTRYYFRPISGRIDEKIGGIELSIVLPEMEVPVLTTIGLGPTMCNYLLEYIKLGANNNPVEVRKLENFLNQLEGENLAVNGVYEQVDFEAVERFQKKYGDDVLIPWGIEDPTGYVYITTKKKINEIYCQKEFPLTAGQLTEIEDYKKRDVPAEIGSIEQEVGMDFSPEINLEQLIAEANTAADQENKTDFFAAGLTFLPEWIDKVWQKLPSILLMIFLFSLMFLLYKTTRSEI